MYTKENPNQQILDLALNKEILIGYCNRDAYKIERYKRWFDDWYERQEPEVYVLNKLDKSFLEKLEIIVFGATWCGACRVETARFYKIFDMLGISFDNVSLLYLNRQKKIPGMELDSFNISRVPTFVFKLNNKEIGRITEQPKDTLEADLLEIQNKIAHA
jgi:thiol-disulfide isomerase/thioredoxin